MISVLVKKIMSTCNLKQQELADVLGVPLQRVKRLSGGEAKKFTQQEQALLIDELDISPEWLITGEGPMFRDSESQEEFARRMQAIDHMRAVVEAMPLPELQKKQLAAVMNGNPAEDGLMIAQFLQSGITETAVHQAVTDAVDLLSLEDKIDARQLAKAVVKLVKRHPTDTPIAASAGGVVLSNVTGGNHTIAGGDMTINRGKSK